MKKVTYILILVLFCIGATTSPAAAQDEPIVKFGIDHTRTIGDPAGVYITWYPIGNAVSIMHWRIEAPVGTQFGRPYGCSETTCIASGELFNHGDSAHTSFSVWFNTPGVYQLKLYWEAEQRGELVSTITVVGNTYLPLAISY